MDFGLHFREFHHLPKYHLDAFKCEIHIVWKWKRYSESDLHHGKLCVIQIKESNRSLSVQLHLRQFICNFYFVVHFPMNNSILQ